MYEHNRIFPGGKQCCTVVLDRCHVPPEELINKSFEA